MKILIAHKYWYHRDGSTTHVADLADMLLDRGHEVIPFGMKSARLGEGVSDELKKLIMCYEEFFVSEIDFHAQKNVLQKVCAWMRTVYSLEAKRQFEKLITCERPDIVHIHNIYHHISPSILNVCTREKIPVIQTVHDYKLICPNYKLFANGAIDEGCLGGRYFHDAINRSVHGSFVLGIAAGLEMTIHRVGGLTRKSISTFIVPSACVREKLISDGITASRIKVLPHFVRPYVAPIAVKEDYLLCVGRLSEEKGFQVAIEALRFLPHRLVIAGSGPFEKELRVLAKRLGVCDRVAFFGFTDQKKIRDLMARAVCTLVPSLWHEPFGYVMPESFLALTPVIGSDSGAISELLAPISQELIVPAGDAHALARAVTALMDQSEKCKQLAQKGRNYFLQKNSVEHYYDSLMSIYLGTGDEGLEARENG